MFRRIIFVLGGPGSGKGTLCHQLKSNYGYYHLSIGEMLRNTIKNDPNSDQSRYISYLIKNGQLMPSEFTVRQINKIIKANDHENILIDGFPRNIENYNWWNELADNSFKVTDTIFLDCNEEIMSKRILSRKSDRIDDNLESIKKRFTIFNQETKPIINMYKQAGLIRRFDATRHYEDVYKDVINQINL